MACRFVGLRPEEMNFAKPEKVLEAVRPDVVPDVPPEKKTSRKPRQEPKQNISEGGAAQ